MNIIKRGKILGHDWYFRLGKRVAVDGINSQLDSNDSVLFWEFDDTELSDVIFALRTAQLENSLPPVRILRASTNLSWHAVCMARRPWLKALAVVAATKGIDPEYVRLAAYRKHFTLRMSDKGQGAPRLAHVLESPVPDDVDVGDFIQGVRYMAWRRE